MIFDLSLELDENTRVFPNSPKPIFQQIATVEKEGWNEKKLTFSSHFGTHIDAPSHVIKNGKTLSDFPIDKFVGEAVVIDAKDMDLIEPNLDLVRENDIVFFYTDFLKQRNSTNYFKNNPVLSEKIANELANKKVKIVGIDSWSPDNDPYKIHDILLGKDILILENLANLKNLIGKRFMCYVLPLKISLADGAPCRVIAQT